MSDSSLMGITIMDITDFNITELDADTKTALSLHQSILQAEQTAANAMVTLCESLKTIRDRQLYKPLGFETFDGYTERACGIKRRQAYNYISVYEKLGSTVLQSNASLGITKLQLLTEVCAVDREDFITENNLDGMSVSEIKKLVEKSKEQGEQISLLSDELEGNEKSKEILLSENEELRRQVFYQFLPVLQACRRSTANKSFSLLRKMETEKRKNNSAAVFNNCSGICFLV